MSTKGNSSVLICLDVIITKKMLKEFLTITFEPQRNDI